MIFGITPEQAYAIASNIRDGDNPPYTVADFRLAMPAFTTEMISDEQLAPYVDLALSVVLEARWHAWWREGMRLFIAHFVSLFLMLPEAGATREEIVNASKVGGSVSSKTVGPVSVSYDNTQATGDLTGWAAWKLTSYGTQFATLARMLGKGGMFIR